MAEGRPDESPTAPSSPVPGAPEPDEPGEQATAAASAEGRIDPLSVAASGLVDVSELTEDRPGLRSRIGRRRDREAAPEAAREPTSTGTEPPTPTAGRPGTSEPSDPLAVLAAALDAEQAPAPAPSRAEPARARHSRRRTPPPGEEPTRPGDRQAAVLPESFSPAPVDPRVPSSDDVARAAADADLPPALVELAAEAGEGVPIEPRRRGTFRRRGADSPTADATGPSDPSDETLFEGPVAPASDLSSGATEEAATPGAEPQPESDTEIPTATVEDARPRTAKHVAEVFDDPSPWQPLHEPQPYVASAPATDVPEPDQGEASAAHDAGRPETPESVEPEVDSFADPVEAAPVDVSVAISSDEVTGEWSDDDLQATQWASQWSPAVPPDPVATPITTPAAEASQPTAPMHEQGPEEEHSVSWEKSENNEEAEQEGSAAPQTAAERRRRSLLSRRRGGRTEAAASPAVASTSEDAGSPAHSPSGVGGPSTPLDLLSGYTSAATPGAGDVEEGAGTPAASGAAPTPVEQPAAASTGTAETETAQPAPVEPAATGGASGHELWDEPDTDGDTEESTERPSHEGWLSRRRGGSRRRVDAKPAESASGSPVASDVPTAAVETSSTPDSDVAVAATAVDAAESSEGQDAGSTAAQDSGADTAADTAVDTSDYPWTAADLAGQGWTREDLLGAGWNDEQLAAVGWTDEFEASLRAGAEQDPPSGPEPAREVTSEEADQQLAETTDDRVEELATAAESAPEDDAAAPSATEADQQLAETTDDPVEELATAEPAPEEDAAEDSATEADQQLAETTDDPVEELAAADEPAPEDDAAAPIATEADQQLAESTDDPVEELLDAPAPADLVVEEAAAPPATQEAARPRAATPAPRAADFDLFYDDDLGVEPESFDIEAPLARRAPASTNDDLLLDEPLTEEPAPAVSLPAAQPAPVPTVDDAAEVPESSPTDSVDAPAEQESEPAEGPADEPETDDSPTGTLVASIGAPITVADEAAPAVTPDAAEQEAVVEDDAGSPTASPDPDAGYDEGTEAPGVVEHPADAADDEPKDQSADQGTGQDADQGAEHAPEPEDGIEPEDGTEDLVPEPVADRSDPFSAGSWSSDEHELTQDDPGSDADATASSAEHEAEEDTAEDHGDDTGDDTGDQGDDTGDQGDGPWWPGNGPDTDGDTPPAPSGAAAEQSAGDEPEPMTYAWALAELAGEHGSDEEPGSPPTLASLSEPGTPQTLSDLVGTDEEAAPSDDVGPEPHASEDEPADEPVDAADVLSAPPPEQAAETAARAQEGADEEDASAGADGPEADDDSSWTSSWSPTWQPTGSAASAEQQPSAASPGTTETLVDETDSLSSEPTDPFAPVPVVPARTVVAIPSPDDTTAAAERLGHTADGDEIPPFVEYRPTAVRRYVLGVLFVATSLLAVLAIFYAVQQGGTAPAITAAAVTVLAGAFWWGLLSWAPRIVSISRGILEVAQGPTSERFDLRDPDTEVVVGDNPRSHAWTTTVVRPNGTKLVIKPSQVRPQQFSTIVEHYRHLDVVDAPDALDS